MAAIWQQTVALGYSKFCELFTQDEWEGFEYSYVQTQQHRNFLI